MRKFFGIIPGLIVLFFLPLARLHAEEIIDFSSDISIQSDGTIDVKESILYDFGSTEKHGIFRSIPSVKTNAEGKKFILSLSGFSVLDEKGSPYTFFQSTATGKVIIKIGNPDIHLTGQHLYTIGYRVSGALTYFSDHDELFWNSTGNEWTVPIRQSSVTVALPKNIPPVDAKVACYTGTAGSKNSDCTVLYENGEFHVRSDKQLAPSEGITFVVGFPKNIVAVLEPKAVNTALGDFFAGAMVFLITVGTLIWYLILPIWIVVGWVRHGRDPKSPAGVAHVWFSPPVGKNGRDLTPGETGTVFDERVDSREISATIVDLARRGYLKIVESKINDFSFVKVKGTDKRGILQPFEQELYDGLFKDGDEVRIKDGKFVSTVAETKKKIYDAVMNEKFFGKNPEDVRNKYTILGVFALLTLNFPLTLSAFIFGRAMPRKTTEGVTAANIAKALKSFLISQDRQFSFQAKKQLLFEKLLPYAIAFGVEKIWAERFKDMNLQTPDWYEGQNLRTFNSIVLVNSLNSSMNSFVSAATPTSSSSGFSSGFSGGGGSSGGGGGGGGGGSW